MKTTLHYFSFILCLVILLGCTACTQSKPQTLSPDSDTNKKDDPVLPDIMAGDGTIYAEGIDISKWQSGNINFTDLVEAGYSYVIIRCGSTLGKDDCFEDFYAQAKAAGLNVGTYYYSYATTIEDAELDADNCLSWIAGKTFEYPIYFDFEDPSQIELDTTLQARICYTFLDKMQENGYLTGLYSMASVMEQGWVTSFRLRNMFEGWVAHYHTSESHEVFGATYSTSYGMYQYTDNLYVNEMGPYDGNVCYKDYPSIVKNNGLNGYEKNTAQGAE